MGNLYGQHRSNQRGDVFEFRKKANCYHSCLSVWHEYVFLLFLRTPRIRPLPYPVQLREHLNLVPFRVIKNYLRIFTRPANRIFLPYALTNFLGNILLFIPLGFFPPMLLKKMQKFWKTMLLVLGIMVTVEILQMLLLVGTCDVDDIILNAFGASIGYGIFKCTGKRFTSPAGPCSPD